MSPLQGIATWKKAPAIRLLVPLTAGIMLQWYLQFSLFFILYSLVASGLLFLLFFFFPLSLRFKLQWFQGLVLNLVIIAFALLITWQKDDRKDQGWYGHYYKPGDALLVRLEEPLIEKSRSYKAEAMVEAVVKDSQTIACTGKLLLYFSKEAVKDPVGYGSRVLIRKTLQSIKNSGNPGAFDYQRYASFQQIFHHVFLKETDWTTVPGQTGNWFRKFIFNARAYVLSALRNGLRSGKDELGIAEALLIGYTNDLDKDLVQAYSNTGVVHIIAISGMHLGLIYVLLLWIFARLPLVKKAKWMQGLLVLICLWTFSLLTGGSASVIRSAVMFTFILSGKILFEKQSSVISSLASSAFVLLCYNPYYLWDVGFQLSYLAVTGIIVFQKPVYNIFYIKNKWADKVWQLAAVSVAAQLLTFPVCIYYFHQFPNLFLIANIIAVPLSAIILYAAIALVALSWIPFFHEWIGKLVASLVWIMNGIIRWINELPFAVWDNIHATVISTWLMYAAVIGFSAWFVIKEKKLFRFGLISLLAFSAWSAMSKWQVINQRKLIVYNVPRYQAIDFVMGSGYCFVGDSVLLKEGLLQNFHLKPGRISWQLNKRIDSLPGSFPGKMMFQFGDQRIAIISHSFTAMVPARRPVIDVVILSRNPPVSIKELAKLFDCKQYVFDASNSSWKIESWQKECRVLALAGYSVSTQGAFILDIGM